MPPKGYLLKRAPLKGENRSKLRGWGLEDKNEESNGEAKKVFLGEYELIRKLAVGGMAEIYLAKKTGMHGFEKKVVLKKIHPHNALNSEFVTMFLDEARIAARLQHANVAQVYDIGCEEGQYYFTMEHVHGEDVRNLVRYASRHKEPIDIDLVLTIVRDVAAGLHNAHEERDPMGKPLGIVHRDVSLSNIIVSFDGCVKVVDFGVAKAAKRESETKAGTLKGKVGYMSPEQVRGREVDRRSDVFSLGIVMYELFAAKRLFRGKTPVVSAHKITNDPTPSKIENRPDVPECVLNVLKRALAKNPDDRYQNARAFQVAIEKAAGEAGVTLSNAELGDYMQDIFSEKMTLTRLMDKEHLIGNFDQTDGGFASTKEGHSSKAKSSYDDNRSRLALNDEEKTQAQKRMALGTDCPVYESEEVVVMDVPVTSSNLVLQKKNRPLMWALGAVLMFLMGAGFWVNSRGQNKNALAPGSVKKVAEKVVQSKANVSSIVASSIVEQRDKPMPAPLDKKTLEPVKKKQSPKRRVRKRKSEPTQVKRSGHLPPKSNKQPVRWDSDSALPPM